MTVRGFFDGVEQVEIELEAGKVRLPLFYREARGLGVLIPANVLRLRRLLPDPRFRPAQVFPGIGALIIGALEYYDTDIGPYNELAVAVVTNSPLHAALPGYNLMRSFLSRLFHAYVVHLPVTTEIALQAGRDFYNFPKFLADIDFSDSGGRIACELSQDGERILSVAAEKTPGRDMGEMLLVAELYQFRRPQLAEIKANVTEGAINIGPAKASYDLNPGHPIGREIAEAAIGNQALGCLYLPVFQAILYGPSCYSMPLLSRALTAAGYAPREAGLVGGRG